MADITITNNISGSTTTVTQSYDESTNAITITVTGKIKRNYLFDIKAAYTTTTGETATADLDTDDTGLVATGTITGFDTSQGITLTGDFVRCVRIVDSLTNCTHSFSKAYKTTETSFSGAVQPKKGFEFTQDTFDVAGSYSDAYGSTVKQSFTFIDSNTATATFEMAKVKTSTAVTLTGTAQESTTPTGVNVINEITGDTTETSYSYDETTNTLVLSVSGSVAKDYLFGIVATYTDTTGQSVNVPLDIKDTGLSADVTITDCDTTKDITVSGEFVKANRITNNVYYCDTNLASAYKTTEDILAVFTPIEGYYFSETDFNLKVVYSDKYGESVSKNLTRVSDTEATITLSAEDVGASYKVTFNGFAQVKPEDVLNLGSVYAYIVDEDILTAFAAKRYFTESTSYYLVSGDLGDYVNRIKRIFAKFTKGADTILKCGNYNTGIECKSIKSQIITLSFGYLKLPLINGDSNDFNATVKLMLPFVGIVDLDSSLLGHTVGLDIYIDVVTGDGVFKLTCDGYPVKMYDCTPSQDVLWRTYNGDNIGGDEWNSPLLYGLDPYVIISYHDTVNKDVNGTTKQVALSEVSGFATFTDVDVSGFDCLQSERDEIKAYIESGIIL